MKKFLFIPVAALIYLASCKKSSAPAAPPAPAIIQDTITVESIIGTADFDPTRRGFIDLYDGTTYNQAEASASSSKIDFAYNYHGGGCSSCRFFENVKDMSTRTGYVNMFSTTTNSLIMNAEYYSTITSASFDSIHNANDIDTLFVRRNLLVNMYGESDITNRTTDVAVGKIFAFQDKSGKKGFFRISDYVANVPDGDRALLTLTVKIQK